MRVQSQFYPTSSTVIPHANPQAMEKNIISYAPKCLPVKKSDLTKESFHKDEKEDPALLNHAFRVYGTGKIIHKTI